MKRLGCREFALMFSVFVYFSTTISGTCDVLAVSSKEQQKFLTILCQVWCS